jgi:hypothetical protein
MKVDLELLTFIGVLLTLIVSVFSIWDRIKPNFPFFSVFMGDRRTIIIENVGTKMGKITEIRINGEPLQKFSYERRKFPILLETHNKIQIQIPLNDSVPTPEECSLTYKKFLFNKTQTFSL